MNSINFVISVVNSCKFDYTYPVYPILESMDVPSSCNHNPQTCICLNRFKACVLGDFYHVNFRRGCLSGRFVKKALLSLMKLDDKISLIGGAKAFAKGKFVEKFRFCFCMDSAYKIFESEFTIGNALSRTLRRLVRAAILLYLSGGTIKKLCTTTYFICYISYEVCRYHY